MTPSNAGSRTAIVTLLALLGLGLVAPPAGAATGDVTESPIPTPVSLPQGIAVASDGAIWFAERSANAIGLLSNGSFSEYPLPNAGSAPFWITAGPDGNLWFTERTGNRIGSITPTGAITEYPLPTASSQPGEITTGPDGALWFTEQSGNRIGRITTLGQITEFPLPRVSSGPIGIAAGPDAALWFTELTGNRIGRITTAGQITEFPLVFSNRQPTDITTGADGNLWFTERLGNAIGRITPGGSIDEFVVPASTPNLVGIAAGPDGHVWFAELGGNNIGRVTADGTITEYPLPNPNSQPYAIAQGTDGAMWFTEQSGNRIGRIEVQAAPPPDTTPPTISITSPADGAVFSVGQVVLADYACADEVGGSGIASCDGPVTDGAPIDTSLGTHTFTVNASDVAGNVASASTSYAVAPPPDTTPPSISISIPADGAVFSVGQVVLADYACADEVGGSGIASCDGPVTDGAPIDTSLGTHTFTVNASDVAANGASASTSYVVAPPPDTTSPTVTTTSPGDGAVYSVGQVVLADYACGDEVGGSGIASCDGPVTDGAPIDTSLGTHTFTVNASDVAGNVASASTSYVVLGDLGGQLRPAPAWNAATAGSALTLSFDLGSSAGSAGSNRQPSGKPEKPRGQADVKLFSPGFPKTQRVDCGDPATTLGPAQTANVDANVSKDGRFHLVWKSDERWAGTCRALILGFDAPGWRDANLVFLVKFR